MPSMLFTFSLFQRIYTNFEVATTFVFMKMSLVSLSKLLKIRIAYDNVRTMPYLRINKKYIVTEHFFTKELELNNLDTYEWHKLSTAELSDILTFQSTFYLQKESEPIFP
jgi:hypothetical protein